MSKFYKLGLMCAAALIPMSIIAQDYPASTSTQVYDQTPWENFQILKLFSDAYDDGRNYPTKEEFEEIGLTMDLEFVRSHTRQRPTYQDASKDIVQDINHDRRLWCNLPAGYGKGLGGYPSTEYDQDVFSFWNYTNLFGAWNYGFLQAPGAWIDAAHKNGTRMYGGIAFFESWNNDGSEGTFQKFIETKNDAGTGYTFKYSRAFVNAAAFFGSDGYNYNSEGTIYSSSDFVNFHAEVKKIANELNILGFGIGQYTQNANASASNIGYIYGSSATGEIYDCMLNYSGNMLYFRGVPGTISAVEAAGLSMDNIYQGHLLVGLSGDYWTQMNTDVTKKMNIVIWGEHDQSRFFQFRIGEDPLSTQANYQKLMEKAFSGANRNPLNRPAINNSWGKFQVADPSEVNTQLDNSPGFASMFAERTAIGPSLPFETYFALGNGESYFYKGKVTHGSWYNMSQQDIVPTYRWLVTAKDDMTTYANDINVEFTHEDAYMAGSAIRLSGATANGNDIVLYRTNLEATAGNVKVDLAVKRGKEGTNASNLSVILRKKGSDAWIEVPYGNTTDKTWEAKTLEVAGIAKGDIIEYIGLRVNGGTASDYQMLVGHLKVSDDRTVDVAPIRDNSLVVEVKEENTASLSVKLNWEPNYDNYTTSIDKFGMVYNDEVNVDHFEILFKEGEDGKVREVGRTAQWATYIGNIPMEQTATAYVGVRAVSVDLKTMSPTQWVAIPRYTGTLPEPEVEDPYGKTWMSSFGTAGKPEPCVENIWVEKVTTTGATQNLNYQVTSNPLNGVSIEQYYYAADHKMIVEQGQTITINYKGYNSGTGESLQYDFVNAYIDYDGNCSFLDADETIGKFGNLNAGTFEIVDPGLTIQVTIPADAKPGATRLRIVGSDAWTPHPGPTGGTVKGYSIDFPVEIVGNNPGRKAAETYKDRRDQGEPEEPEEVVVDSIEEIGVDATFSSVTVVDNVAYFQNTDKAWFYTVDGRCVKHIADATVAANVADLTAGVYVVKMQNGQVVRSAKVMVK